MAFDPTKHLRDPLGRFRKMNLAPGWHSYRKGDEIRKYYINDMNQLADGSNLLHMSAQGKVFGSVANQDPIERIHIIGTDDMEQMAIAASGETTFGVINHDKAAPPEPFSLNRGHEFQPVGENLPEHETSFGGRAAQLTDRKDGKTYNTLDAQKAEQTNRAAFDDPDARIYSANPSDFAEGAVEARHFYEKEFGLSESEAREMPVYVYADKDGNVQVKPAYKAERVPMEELGMKPDDPAPEGFRSVDGELVAFVATRSPNTHGGSGTVRLRGSDVTRMSRAMQKDGLDSVNFTISGGTKVSEKTGKPLQNALHVRQSYRNEYSHDDVTVWGSIEAKQYGAEPIKSRRQFNDEQGYRKYMDGVREVRNRAASKYTNPPNPETAAKLLRVKYGTNRYYSSDIEMRENGFAVKSADGHTSKISNSEGVCVGMEARDEEGFATIFNWGKSDANRVEVSNVKRLADGNYRVRRNGQESFYTASGSSTRGTRTRDGKTYGYDEAGEIIEIG